MQSSEEDFDLLARTSVQGGAGSGYKICPTGKTPTAKRAIASSQREA